MPAGSTVFNATAVGNAAKVDASNEVRIGNTSVISIGGQVGWTTFSDSRIKKDIKDNVPGLLFINLLKPVTYNYNLAKEYTLLSSVDSNNYANKNDVEKIIFTGFIAQDVDAAAKKIDYNFSGIDKTGKIWGLRYSEFVVPLVKAVQELSSQNDSLKQSNQALSDKLNALSNKINQIETAISQCCNIFTSNMQTLNNQVQSKAINAARLDQNVPNPFNNSSSISYYISSSFHNAQLTITNVSGQILKSFTITQNGYGKQIISANELASGAYQYTLLVDGKIIDTKKMVISK